MKNSTTNKDVKSPTVLSREPLSETKQQATPQATPEATLEELYIAKNFKGAAEYLLKNKQQFDSGIYFYNLGTVYSKLGDYANARYLFEKSMKEGFINSSSYNNLNFVREKLDVDDLSSSSSIPDQILNVSLALPSSAYTSMTLLLLILVALLIQFKKLTHKLKITMCLFLALVPMLVSYSYLNQVNEAIILKDIAVYEGPSKIFSEKGKLKAGSKVVLGEFKDGWFFIEFPLSQVGWIAKDQVGLY
jgi:hypothetical protein